jgi:hypothetical protein
MVAAKAQDAMDKLLSCDEPEPLPETGELNELIYREDDGALMDVGTAARVDRIRNAGDDTVTVQVGESRAKIRVTVAPDAQQNLSMKTIADIAAKAIIDELKRDTQ